MKKAFVTGTVIFCLILTILISFNHKQTKRLKKKIKKLDPSYLWLNREFPVLKKIEKLILEKKPQNKTDLIDKARWFIRNGFAEKHDKWYDEHAWHTEIALQFIYHNNINPSSEPAHLDCGPSTRALACILNYFDFQTRIVHFLTDDFDYVAGHTLLEVLNPDTGKWELQDPLYNIYFYHIDTRQRASALDLVFSDIEKIIPSDGKLHGWDKKMHSRYSDRQPKILKDHYFEVLLYGESKRFVLINNEKISLTKRFPKNNNLTILEFIKKSYANPPVFALSPGVYQAH